MCFKSLILIAAAALAVPTAQPASITVTVNGNDDPFLAGALSGTTCCGGDNAPAHSPTEVLLFFSPGDALTFSVAPGGFFNNFGGASGPGADGSSLVSAGPFLFIGGYTSIPLNSLVGVFLGSGVPAGPTPAQFTLGASGTDFATLAPLLQQVFFIGDGLRTDGVTSQQFIVPAGATRLFLGSTDGSGWFNNTGSHSVTVTAPNAAGAVPEPSTLALAGLGLIAAGLVRRRRSR